MVSIRNWLSVVLVLGVLLSAAACGTVPASDPEASTDPHGFTTAPLPTDQDGSVTYRVTVQDEAGNPLVGVFVQLNLEQSIPAVTNEQGVATWTLPQDAYSVSLVTLPSGYDYTGATREFFFADDSGEMTITLMAQSIG